MANISQGRATRAIRESVIGQVAPVALAGAFLTFGSLLNEPVLGAFAATLVLGSLLVVGWMIQRALWRRCSVVKHGNILIITNRILRFHADPMRPIESEGVLTGTFRVHGADLVVNRKSGRTHTVRCDAFDKDSLNEMMSAWRIDGTDIAEGQ
jgi:hypothetical protein